MGIFEPDNTVCGRAISDSDNVLPNNISTGLDEVDKLPTLKIVGALCNPLPKNRARMVADTLCSRRFR